ELLLACHSRTRTGALTGMGSHAQVGSASGGLGLELLPPPEPDEVVAALLEEPEVCAEVERLGGLSAVRAGTHAVVEVVPDMRAGQVNHLPAGVAGFAGRDREVARIGL